MIVFRSHEHQSVGTLAEFGETRVLDLFSRVVVRELKLSNIDVFSLDAFAFLDLFENKLRNVLAGAAFPHRAENHGNEKWSIAHGAVFYNARR